MIHRDGSAGGAFPREGTWERAVLDAVRGLRFGAVEILVHEGRVVQVETREKVRFDEAGRRRPDTRWRDQTTVNGVDPTSGGTAAQAKAEETTS